MLELPFFLLLFLFSLKIKDLLIYYKRSNNGDSYIIFWDKEYLAAFTGVVAFFWGDESSWDENGVRCTTVCPTYFVSQWFF